jgi:hypothetical protein
VCSRTHAGSSHRGCDVSGGLLQQHRRRADSGKGAAPFVGEDNDGDSRCSTHTPHLMRSPTTPPSCQLAPGALEIMRLVLARLNYSQPAMEEHPDVAASMFSLVSMGALSATVAAASHCATHTLCVCVCVCVCVCLCVCVWICDVDSLCCS